MLVELLYNPIFLIFISYTIGATLTPLVLQKGDKIYHSNHHFLNDKWTKRIGVLHLGWLIRHSFMRLFNQKIKYQGKLNKEKLRQLKQEMTNAEIGHLIGFIVLVLVNIFICYYKLVWWYVLLFFMLNIIFNFNLVLLQQYNKRRIEILIKKGA